MALISDFMATVLLLINQIVAYCLFLFFAVIVMENLLAVSLSETAGSLHIKSPFLYLIDVAGLGICCFEVLLSQN